MFLSFAWHEICRFLQGKKSNLIRHIEKIYNIKFMKCFIISKKPRVKKLKITRIKFCKLRDFYAVVEECIYKKNGEIRGVKFH